ncbi:MAG: HIT domain-containing protein [bacterium]
MKYEEFLKNMKECPFCDGGNRIITESDKSFLTYALWPYHKHHLLFIPKRHVESLTEITEDEMKDISMLQEKSLEILKKLGYISITQLVREGNVINKAVNHVHFHTIPNILIGDLNHYGQERSILSEEEIDSTIKDIKKFI